MNIKNTWIVKKSNTVFFHQLNLNNCSYNLLNPNIGADIYEIHCLRPVHFKNAETSKIWKISYQPKRVETKPNDPMNGDQWGLDAINIRSFWKNVTVGNRRVQVAIIDTGVNYFHEDLQANLGINVNEIPSNGIDDDGNGYIDDYYGWDAANNSSNPMDVFDHGTHIAGVIGASSNNDIGITGMNWNVSIIPIKFIDNQAGGSTESAIRAIDYAVVRGAKIITMSWGGTRRSPLLEEVMERCRAKGILFIAAAGNESNDNDIIPTYPASYPLDNVISVAAIDLHQNLTWFSNWGAKSVHIAAPGESILSTVGTSRYGFKEGTSMAVPHIAGAAALIWSNHPDWTYLQVKDYLLGRCISDPSQIIPVLCRGFFSF